MPWDDLAGRVDGFEAARELTRRIDEGLREVTLNLERWEDAPLVEWAEEVYAAELGVEGGGAGRVGRLGEAAGTLARLRRDDGGEWRSVAREVSRHGRVLRALGLRPADLHADAGVPTAARWARRRLAFFLGGVPLAAAGAVVFYLPYRLTGVLERRARPARDVRATFKLLVGSALHLGWTLALAAAAGAALGWEAGVAALLVLPLLGFLTVAVRNRWDEAADDARRFFRLRRRGYLLPLLRARQRELAERLRALR